MGIEIGSDILLQQMQQSKKDAKITGLQNKLTKVSENPEKTDEEVMEVCKEFEAYLVEKVMTGMRDAMTTNEDGQGEYLSYFGDMMYQEYAKKIADNGELGLAKQLYESMKRNTVSPVQAKVQETK